MIRKFLEGKINDSYIAVQRWAFAHYSQLAIYNLTIFLLILLRSAGYFEPIFLISINLIVFVALILSILILGARSKALFMISLIFLSISTFFLITRLNIWAQRAVIYFFEAFIIGLIVLIFEQLPKNTDYEK